MTRTILVYGDSNSHGTAPMADLDGGVRFDRATRWPGVMAAQLGPDWHLVEEGHPGRTTVHDDPVEGPHRNGRRILPAILASHKPLDVVVLMLGTNDLKHTFGMTPREIADGCDKLLQIIATADCGPANITPKLLLICPPPVLEAGCLAEIFTGGAARSQRLPPEYARVATRHGAAFLDAGRIIVSSPLDGVHFDQAEHRKLGQAVARAIAAIPF